ncbi:MAG TPA: polysaccharide biosynthesis tyrosine autokinase [Bacteroidales bacterium]|nr:polysaccharide biosynthesis tyrosine autokinase [Bacteroidales bacterium]
MEDHNTLYLDTQGRVTKQSSGLDPLAVFNLLKKNWYWFVLTTLFALFGAKFYLSHTMPLYQTSVTVLINETEDRPLVDNSQLLQGLGLPGAMKNLENQIMVIKSRALTEKTLEQLPFEIDYYIKTFRNSLPIYPDSPVKVSSETVIPLPKDTEFSITSLGNNTFRIASESEYYPFEKTARFGDTIRIAGGSFKVDCADETIFQGIRDQVIFFTVHSMPGLVNYFNSRLNVELLSREGSVLRISMVGTNSAKDADFLNKHVEGFQSISLDKKNTEAIRRIQFIEDQLVGISDSLSSTETRLQQFRSSHRVMDLSAQGQSIIAQVTLLENERARLNLEANYYDYLADYLTKNASGEVPIIPITMGITDPGLTRLVEELAELQGQLSSRGAGEMNPLQRNLEQRVQTTKEALKETLNGLRRANSLARSENQEQINKANAQASALPVTERQLLGIERKFRLNDELYTFLLETRAEQEMQKASNRADSEVIDPADTRFSFRVSPNPAKIYFLGLFAGFGLPFLILFLNFLFDNKLKLEDVKKLTQLPALGNMPHNSDGTNNMVVFENPNSALAESYRLLRARMQFLTKEESSPVILVTSSMPGEGKTFTSINLASVYTLLGKKTIIVGFDLRKPKIHNDFKLKNDKGVSTWLIGQDNLQDVIQETSYTNLSVITSGPVPPNPSELTALGKTEELFKLLRERFDYIIVDSSPIGLVSDTYHLASMTDACLLVVRPGYTQKDIFERTLSEIYERGMRGVSLVINDIKSDRKHYGYGEKYGYTNDKKSRRRWFKKLRVSDQ